MDITGTISTAAREKRMEILAIIDGMITEDAQDALQATSDIVDLFINEHKKTILIDKQIIPENFFLRPEL